MIQSTNMARYIQQFTLVVIILIVAACSTTKSRDDLSALGMAYQNTTARYNGYFNATEIMKESYATLETEHKDNYNQLLPVFEYNAIGDPKSVAGDLDEAIKKSSVVISLHRPSKWTDDCYLLIGQAQYLKQDYESAQKTLEYMVNNFDEYGKSTAKVKEKPSKAQTKAERIKRIQEKNKEIQARRKKALKERAERNKEIQAEKKERAKSRKQQKKEREKTNKSRKKEREKAKKQRVKDRKKANKEAAKRRKNAKKKKPSSRKTPSSKTEKKVDEKPATKKTTPTPKSDKKQDKTSDKKVDEEKKEIEEKEKNKKKKNKKEQKAKDGALAHRPAKPYGQLWLAKTYIERDFLTQADRLFKQAEANANGDKKLLEELYPSMAHYYIYTENYAEAVPALEKAIEHTKRKALKARYSFIIGQLNAMLGNNSAALAAYDQAASWSRDYEMEFNAKLNSKLASLSGGKSGERVAKELERMLKDEKNEDFKDQIYFQIAKVYLEEGNQQKAEEYLTLALEHAKSPAQKGEIHYALGNIHFDNDAFDLAYDHYSQALAAMDKSDMRRKNLQQRTDDIKLIATNLKELNLQDSLLMLAGLSEDELKKRAKGILAEREELKAAAAEKMAAATGAKNAVRSTALPSTVSPTASAGKYESNFFAYNDRDLRKGEREFSRIWGSRPLVDDWRRNETGEVIINDEEDSQIDASSGASAITSSELESVFSGLPKSEEQITEANTSIANALYNLGMNYRNNLERLDLSSEAFNRFVDDYPNDERVPEALYFLYLNAKDAGNMALAKQYADRLNQVAPGTKYALLAGDPDYINTLNDDGNSIESFYEKTYDDFNQGKYASVVKAFEEARSTYGTENDYIAKFALLKAMSIGKEQGKEQYVEALRTVVAQYPNTPEQIRAREIIRFLGGDENAFGKGQAQAAIQISNFKVEADKLHYILVVLHNTEIVSTNEAKIAINKYNALFHKLDKLSIRSTIVNREKKTPAVMIRKFDDKARAMSYYNEVVGRLKEFLPAKTDADIFAISQNNYREMIKAGGAESYKDFFQRNYLKE